MDYRPSGSSVHGILQSRILEWVVILFFRGSSQPRDWTQVSASQADSLPSESPGKPSYLPLCSQFSSVQSLSCVRLFATPWPAARHTSLSITNSLSLLKLMSRAGDAVQPSHPLSSPSPPAFNLSQHHGSFLRSRLFTSGGQSVGASASTLVLPMNIQDWFPLELTGLMSFLSNGLSRVFFSTTVQKHQVYKESAQLSL